MKEGSLAAMGLLALLLAAAGCHANEDHRLSLWLVNAGAQPLHCRIMFGHWVDRDLGELSAEAAVEIEMMQAARDGALYIPRADGQRLMMIENIVCGRAGNWMATLGQVDLAPLRADRLTSVTAHCAAPADSGRVACTATGVER